MEPIQKMTAKEFTEMLMPLSDALYRIAFYILEDEEGAKDAVQEIFIKLWTRRDALCSVGNLSAYANTLMRNHCIDLLRKSSRVRTESIEEHEETAIGEEPDEARERLKAVLDGIERLPSRQKEVLKMLTMEGLSYREIASKKGISELNARVLVSKARSKLKKNNII